MEINCLHCPIDKVYGAGQRVQDEVQSGKVE